MDSRYTLSSGKGRTINSVWIRTHPFDTPAPQAAQGERTLHQLGGVLKKPFMLILNLAKDRSMDDVSSLQLPFPGSYNSKPMYNFMRPLHATKRPGAFLYRRVKIGQPCLPYQNCTDICFCISGSLMWPITSFLAILLKLLNNLPFRTMEEAYEFSRSHPYYH